MKIFYKDVDISDKVELLKCVHDMHAEGEADTLRIKFADEGKLWDSWKPAKNDLIRILSNDVDSGQMYVSKLKIQDGFLWLTACSVPETMFSVKTKPWKDISFKRVAKDVAAAHGLKIKFYSVTDKKYKVQYQKEISDALFLKRLCILEGYAFLVFDQTLIIYAESEFEKKDPLKIFSLEDNDVFDLDSDRLFGSCSFVRGKYKGYYKQAGAQRVCSPDFSFQVSSTAEANRYAKNFLRYANKKRAVGYKEMIGIDAGITPGTVLTLETTQAKSWNGPVFVTRVRNEYIDNSSKVFFRKPLAGY